MNGDTAHREVNFEKCIVSELKAQGWKVGDTKHYDTERAMYPEDLEEWLKTTQPDKWKRLQADNPENTIEAVMDRVVTVLDSDKGGTICCTASWSWLSRTVRSVTMMTLLNIS